MTHSCVELTTASPKSLCKDKLVIEHTKRMTWMHGLRNMTHVC